MSPDPGVSYIDTRGEKPAFVKLVRFRMNTPEVIGIVLVLYFLTCIRTWRKIDRAGLPAETKSGHAVINPLLSKGTVQK